MEAFERNDGIDVDTVRVLKMFFDERRDISSEEVAFILDMKSSVADFHIDDLRKRKFILQSRAIMHGSRSTFAISPEGRAFVVKHRMA